MGFWEIFQAIAEERSKQDRKWGTAYAKIPNVICNRDGTRRSLAQHGLPSEAAIKALEQGDRANGEPGSFAGILAEEAVEVVSAAIECSDTDESKLRAELVQLAAVAVKWIQAIDQREVMRSFRAVQQAHRLPPRRCALHLNCDSFDEKQRSCGIEPQESDHCE